VYIEARPRRIALHADSCASFVFSNSFASYSFRTLTSHLKATVSSNSFAIKRFRTLCKIPGIGYPPSPIAAEPRSALPPQSYCRHSTPLLSTACGLLLHNGAPQPLCFQTLPDSFHCNGGCIPPSTSYPFTESALREGTNGAVFRNKFFACHTCVFHGGEGGGVPSSLLKQLLWGKDSGQIVGCVTPAIAGKLLFPARSQASPENAPVGGSWF
jgi:hypothetical protein